MRGKVIIFIVEGASDEETLMPWIEKRLNELEIRVKIKIMSGDILTKYIENTQKYEITSSNVKGEINKKLKEFMNSSDMRADYLKWKDILKIYYVTDTDNCFKKNESYLENKRECLKKMFKFEMIGADTSLKKFEVIFFGNNLEHVIYNETRQLTKEEKEMKSKEFGEKTLTEEWNFKEKFENNGIKNWYSYEESYREIQEYEGRSTNITALIQEIETKKLKIIP